MTIWVFLVLFCREIGNVGFLRIHCSAQCCWTRAIWQPLTAPLRSMAQHNCSNTFQMRIKSTPRKGIYILFGLCNKNWMVFDWEFELCWKTSRSLMYRKLKMAIYGSYFVYYYIKNITQFSLLVWAWNGTNYKFVELCKDNFHFFFPFLHRQMHTKLWRIIHKNPRYRNWPLIQTN